MGFFNFGKQNKNRAPQSETEEPKAERPSVEQPPIATPPMPPPAEETQVPFLRKKSKKEEAGPETFFSIDIYNIFKYKPQLLGEVAVNGKPAEKYTLKLKDLELDTFYKVEILKYKNEKYDLVFMGNVNEIRNGIIEFIDFCLKAYGPDFMNRGSISPEDRRDLSMGVFSRIWYNRLQINNLDFKVSLTIQNITPKEI